jgi:hypothetical protein
MFDDLDRSAQTAELRLRLAEVKKDPAWAIVLEHDNLTFLRRK